MDIISFYPGCPFLFFSYCISDDRVEACHLAFDRRDPDRPFPGLKNLYAYLYWLLRVCQGDDPALLIFFSFAKF